jgi:hypothetical protein
VRAYGDEAVGRIVAQVREMVLQAREQPADSRAYGSLENTTLFGVAAQVGGRYTDAWWWGGAGWGWV